MAALEDDRDPRALARTLEGTRALVLGASGFLGRWVARTLAASRADLHLAVRDVERGSAVLERWGARGRIHAVDLSRESEVEDLLARVEPAVVFNLAGYGVGQDEIDERASTDLNALLPERLVRSFRTGRHPDWRGVEIVHVGSAFEYGEAGGDLRETTACRPTTLYGRTKLEGTLALRRASTTEPAVRKPRAITVRLFTVYGAGERDGRLLPTLLQGGAIALSSGVQRRDFLYAEDAAEGLVRLALSPARPGEIVNLATGRLSSVRDFAHAAARLVGIDEARLRFGALPVRAGEMDHDPVNVERLRELAGWTPPADLDAAIARALAWPGLVAACEPGGST